MQHLKQKLKKMAPIIKTRQFQLDQHTVLLNDIRQNKLNALKELDRFKELYVNSVATLNEIRQSPGRENLLTLEQSVDVAKSEWYRSLIEVRRMEEKERSQLSNVMKAQQDLKAVEILHENYARNLMEEAKKKEQKAQDEIAIQNFNRQRQES